MNSVPSLDHIGAHRKPGILRRPFYEAFEGLYNATWQTLADAASASKDLQSKAIRSRFPRPLYVRDSVEEHIAVTYEQVNKVGTADAPATVAINGIELVQRGLHLSKRRPRQGPCAFGHSTTTARDIRFGKICISSELRAA